MEHYQYAIVGGGMTADAAVRGIREVDAKGEIVVFGQESHPPYNRPPLSKGLWKGKPLDKIWRKTEQQGATLRLGRRIVSVDRSRKTVTDSAGGVCAYDKLLLATGGTPRRLPSAADGIIYFRTLDDYFRLRDATDGDTQTVVIGGGFIGSEIAAALAMNDKKVTLVFPEDAIGARMYPRALSQYLNDYYREKGITVVAGEGVQTVARAATGYSVTLQGGRSLSADVVVAGLGISPEVELATTAGLVVDNGIVVDENLRTSDPHIYAAGDVANFHNPALGKRIRVEHEDNANTQGAMAGRNMGARSAAAYDHLPYFYSDLFDLGYEAVGELDARLETVEDWKEPFRKGVVYYLKEGRVRGVLLWDTWGKVDAARELIASKETFTEASLKGRIAD